MSGLVPSAVELHPDRLRLQWDDAAPAELPAALLRAACRCGDCRRRALQQGPAAHAAARLSAAAPIGLYALQLSFDDGHDRGIYPWSWLCELAAQPDPRSEGRVSG